MRFSYFLFITLITVLIFSGCKKQVGNVYLPNEGTQGFDGNGYTDSFTLLTRTIREDSLKTDSLSNNLIGFINDPVFGQYKASSFIQYQLPQFNNVLSGTLDSVVILLQYTSKTAYYGDLNSIIDINVHELTEDMTTNKSHSSDNYAYNPIAAATYSGKLKPKDSISIRNLFQWIRIGPTLKIVLPKTNPLAIKLFNASASDLSSQEAFTQYFKGLAFIPTTLPNSGGGAISAFNLLSPYSRISIHYNDSLQSDFRIYKESEKLCKYEVTNQGAQIVKQKGASAKSSFDTSYVMAMTGSKLNIKIPYLLSIVKSKPISIAKAEVIIRPLPGTYNSTFPLPARLLLIQPSAMNGLNAGILDLAEHFYGGEYNLTNNEYRFNITRHIQSIFIDYQQHGINNNNGLFLIVPTDYPIAPSRIYVDTRKKLPGMGIEFKLYYAEL